MRLAMDNLAARVVEIRPAYIGKASSPEVQNFAEFIDSLAVLTRHIERPLDEPPRRTTDGSDQTVAAPRLRVGGADPAVVRYCLKVGFSTVVGYLIGLIIERPDLFIILVTVITTATPSYGATLQKMYLRICGSNHRGSGFPSGYHNSLAQLRDTSGLYAGSLRGLLSVCIRIARQCADVVRGQTNGYHFSLVFVGLSPAVNIYEPLWRIWGVLLGDFVVAIVFFTLWPEYAGDSLLPRLKRVLANLLALAPSDSASSSEDQIQKTNSETMRVLSEFLEIAKKRGWKGAPAPFTMMGSSKRRGLFAGLTNRLTLDHDGASRDSNATTRPSHGICA